MARLKKIYDEEIKAKLMKAFGYTSVMQVPKITKVTLNMGVGKAVQDKKYLTAAVDALALITGQKPQPSALWCSRASAILSPSPARALRTVTRRSGFLLRHASR